MSEPMRTRGESLDRIKPPWGAHAIMKRFERRVAASSRLAHDPLAAAIPRLLARVLSSYERAKAQEATLILLDTRPLFASTS